MTKEIKKEILVKLQENKISDSEIKECFLYFENVKLGEFDNALQLSYIFGNGTRIHIKKYSNGRTRFLGIFYPLTQTGNNIVNEALA